jgi:hypothetical protein
MDSFAFVMLVNAVFIIVVVAGIAGVVIVTSGILQKQEHKSLIKLTAALEAARSELDDGH